MTTKVFDIAKDCEVVASGGFWCEGCTGGKPIKEQSEDPRYCHSCFKFFLDEAGQLPEGRKPSWVPSTKRAEGLPVPKKPVAKIPDKGLEGSGMMQRRGRPKKEGEVHRATDWRRRQKVTQGVLL